MTTLEIARVCHEANRALCMTQKDYSQKKWSKAEQWQKDSAVNGVQFHLDNPHAKPSDSHDNWLKEKVANGWVYGPVKDADTKVHNCIMPYSELPAAQQSKDALFISIVHALK